MLAGWFPRGHSSRLLPTELRYLQTPDPARHGGGAAVEGAGASASGGREAREVAAMPAPPGQVLRSPAAPQITALHLPAPSLGSEACGY